MLYNFFTKAYINCTKENKRDTKDLKIQKIKLFWETKDFTTHKNFWNTKDFNNTNDSVKVQKLFTKDKIYILQKIKLIHTPKNTKEKTFKHKWICKPTKEKKLAYINMPTLGLFIF